MNLQKSELKSTIALALKLNDQRRNQGLSEEELLEVAAEMGVDRQDLEAAIQYNQRLYRKRKALKIVGAALAFALLWVLFSHWRQRIVVVSGPASQLQESLLQEEQVLEQKKEHLARQKVIAGVDPIEALRAKPTVTLAVLPFTNQTTDSKMDGLAASCADAMLMPLSRLSRITLIERLQLSKILDEINLSQTKYVDPVYAIELGKLLNTDFAIMGTLQILDDTMRISARVVSSADGKVIYTERVEGPKAKFFTLQDELAENLAKKF